MSTSFSESFIISISGPNALSKFCHSSDLTFLDVFFLEPPQSPLLVRKNIYWTLQALLMDLMRTELKVTLHWQYKKREERKTS